MIKGLRSLKTTVVLLHFFRVTTWKYLFLQSISYMYNNSINNHNNHNVVYVSMVTYRKTRFETLNQYYWSNLASEAAFCIQKTGLLFTWMNKCYSISLLLFEEIWVKTGPDQVRSIPNTTAETRFLWDFIIRLRLLGTKVVKLLLLLNNDYNNNRSNDYYIPVSDNTSDKTFRTAITLLRTLSNELNTTLHHPQ